MTPSPSPPRGPRPGDRAQARAPGSIGNLGPGLDVLGLAVAGAGDTVVAEWTAEPGVRIADPGHPALPTDPAAHASAIAARRVLERAGGAGDGGVVLHVRKGLPLAAGQGGSAASAVAGAAATNAVLGAPLDRLALVEAALAAETAVAGRHADNVAPSTLGGLVLVRALDPLDLVPVPLPPGLHVVLVRPHMELRTADGRAALPATVPLATALHQAAQVGAIVAAAARGDLALLGRALDDRIAEPARARLLPGFSEAKAAALAAGALGCSISGSGPTVFALADAETTAQRIADAMRAAYAGCSLESDARLARPDLDGVRTEPA